MCGISVIISKNKSKVPSDELEKLNSKIAHRGPDDNYTIIKNNFGFAFRRLSIIDLSINARQPMIDSSGNIIVFNGEIFNYVELRNELISHGQKFKTSSDTEVIMSAYKFWGKDCFKRFNGMWGIVLFDKLNNQIIASRDRFGIKPIYYWENHSRMLFFSEIKQLTDLNYFKPTLNLNSAVNFLASRNLNTNNETFFSDVNQLEAGVNMYYNLDNNKYNFEKYYDLKSIKTEKDMSYEYAISKFYNLFENSIKIRLRSDVKLGSCLSGGLDSSSIVSIANNLNKSSKINTISCCWTNKKYDEQEYIDEFLKYNNVKSFKIFPKIDRLFDQNLLSDIIYYQDQPIKSTSHFSEFAVFEKAKKEGLTVMLDGQGSDEFLAGYIPFRYYNLDLIKKFKISTFLQEIYHQRKFYRNLKDILLNNLIFFSKSMLPFNVSRNGLTNSVLTKSLLSHKNNINFFHKSYKQNSLHEIMISSIPYQLHSEDRNSMMHSVESRLPFLDFDLADFILTMPDKFKIGKGLTKRVLRDSMNHKLPKKLINRFSKMGFESPEKEFVEKNHFHIEKIIDRAIDRNPNFFSSKTKKYFKQMVNKKIPYDNIFFRICTYQIWLEKFNVKIF